jgi:hypothetical protein
LIRYSKDRKRSDLFPFEKIFEKCDITYEFVLNTGDDRKKK